jgi:hypothetical protein
MPLWSVLRVMTIADPLDTEDIREPTFEAESRGSTRNAS